MHDPIRTGSLKWKTPTPKFLLMYDVKIVTFNPNKNETFFPRARSVALRGRFMRTIVWFDFVVGVLFYYLLCYSKSCYAKSLHWSFSIRSVSIIAGVPSLEYITPQIGHNFSTKSFFRKKAVNGGYLYRLDLDN